jgi:hypothetical protein
MAGITIGLWIPWNNPCVEIAWNEDVQPTNLDPENPRGMQICDYFPTDAERYTKLAVIVIALLILAAIVGVVANRLPVLLGGTSTALGCMLAAIFWHWIPTHVLVPVIDRRLFTTAMFAALGIAFCVGAFGGLLGHLAMRNLWREPTHER